MKRQIKFQRVESTTILKNEKFEPRKHNWGA